MKSSIFVLVFLFSYCSSETLLGGWSLSSDDSLKNECLDKALTHLNGAQISNEIRAEASEVICHTQIVNGLNIKCTFNFRGKKQQCSYYKSFIQTLETQLEQCKEIDTDGVPQTDNPKNMDNREESLADGEKDDEKELPKDGQDDEQQPTEAQLTAADDDDDGGQRLGANLNSEEDDEAAIDQLSQKLSDQASNAEDQPEQNEQQK